MEAVTLLTPSRDALAKALHDVFCNEDAHNAQRGGPAVHYHDCPALPFWQFRADALLASGAVVDASTLVDDEALHSGPVAEAIWLHRSFGADHDDYTAKCGCGRKFVTAVGRQRHAAQETLRALSADLAERGDQ